MIYSYLSKKQSCDWTNTKYWTHHKTWWSDKLSVLSIRLQMTHPSEKDDISKTEQTDKHWRESRTMLLRSTPTRGGAVSTHGHDTPHPPALPVDSSHKFGGSVSAYMNKKQRTSNHCEFCEKYNKTRTDSISPVPRCIHFHPPLQFFRLPYLLALIWRDPDPIIYELSLNP